MMSLKQIGWGISASVVCLAMAGCAVDAGGGLAPVRASTQRVEGTGVALTMRAITDYTGSGALVAADDLIIVTNAEEFMGAFGGDAPPPSVSFGNEWIAYYMPTIEPPAGSKVSIRSVRLDGVQLNVTTRIEAPGVGCTPDPDAPAYAMVAFAKPAAADPTLTSGFADDTTAPTCGTVADPFDPASCTGTSMTKSEAVARFGAGVLTTPLANLKLSSRTRTCNAVTGCTDWKSDTSASFTYYRGYPSYSYGTFTWSEPLSLASRLDVTSKTITLRAVSDLGGSTKRLLFACGNIGEVPSSMSCGIQAVDTEASTYGTYLSVSQYSGTSFTGLVTNNCLRLTASGRNTSSTDIWNETQHVLLGTY